MIYPTVKIAEGTWAPWLQALSEQQTITGFDCNADLFQNKDFLSVVRNSGLNCRILQELLPSDATAAYETALATHTLPQLYETVYRTMVCAFREAQTTHFVLPLRLDRVEDPARQFELQKRFLCRLQFAPIDHAYHLLLPVRIPQPFPSSQELKRSQELCLSLQGNTLPETLEDAWIPQEKRSAIRNGLVKLLLHLYPEEGILPEKADEILSPLLPITAAICFHYNVLAQETLFDDEQAAWAEFLHGKEFHGVIDFAPEGMLTSRIPELLPHIQNWAELYH